MRRDVIIRSVLCIIFSYYALDLLGVASQPPAPTTPSPTPAPGTGDHLSPTFQFGKPEISIQAGGDPEDAYKYVNKYRRTFLFDQYVVLARGDAIFKTHLLFYDSNVDDVVEQNLGKEKYWAFFNTTGTFPSMTVLNTTYTATTTFAAKEGNIVSFEADYVKPFVSTETSPPYDMTLEVSADTRSFRKEKTVVDFQSWGVIRWQLSDRPFVTWQNISDAVEALRPRYLQGATNWTADPSKFTRVDNACLPDIFMLYMVVGDRQSSINQIYADIPAFHLDETTPNFFNLTGSFCPHHLEAAHEECGYVEQLVLTNDHIVALTDKGLYLSASLNSSDKDVSSDYKEKPLLSYHLIDPCAKFGDQIACFKQGISSVSSELIHSMRLFYLPICTLYQYPFYEDRLIFVVEHTSAFKTNITVPPARSVTVLYASTPFTEWKALFIGQKMYANQTILGLVGIFFNHQLRHFDITLKITDNLKGFQYARFVLLDITDPEQKLGYKMLNGLQGNGFLEKVFPGTFQLEEIFVHPGPMDVFFVGSQLWIAESGLAIVYRSFDGFGSDVGSQNGTATKANALIQRCSFNHPDRIFVCVDSGNTRIVVGRVGSSYSPIVVDINTIAELSQAASPHGSHWTWDYFQKIVKKNAYYTSSFAGKILMWYMFSDVELRSAQVDLENEALAAGVTDDPSRIAWCEDVTQPWNHKKGFSDSCIRLLTDSQNTSQSTLGDKRGPYFRMVAIDPQKLRPIREPTAGPLVPFFVDAMTTLLYEGKLSGDEAEHVYFSSVFIGQEINCEHFHDVPALHHVENEINCQLFVRHIKPVHEFLDGFRQILYGTIIKSIPMRIVVSRVTVVYPSFGSDRENLVFVKLAERKYTEEHIGQTHYMPGHFSILLQGFPDRASMDIMWGYATRQYTKKTVIHFASYSTYILDLSTHIYRDTRKTVDQIEWDVFRDNYQLGTNRTNPLDEINLDDQGNPLVPTDPPPVADPNPGMSLPSFDHFFPGTQLPTPSWVVSDGSCNLLLQLKQNNVLYSHGGRVSLDLHDALSFTIVLRPTSELGRLLLYRPLFVLTNSNPEILQVENQDRRLPGTQAIDIMISPTGLKMGVASFSVRSVISSVKCESPTSITFIVQVHRAEGRRLHINYRVPTCSLPPEEGGYFRPWQKDDPFCTPYQDILDAGSKDQDKGEDIKRKTSTIFTYLPKNYRPPSIRGEKIPLSQYTYHADPARDSKTNELTLHNNWYHITNDTRRFHKCNFRTSRQECKCSKADRLSDHPDFTDCKEMAYTMPRGKAFNISIEYDPIMKDEDQHTNFFSPKDHLSVYIEEINKRLEFTLASEQTPVLKAINAEISLNEGRIFYNAHNITITLHGTGLFHFKAGLGKFDSFEEVTGYFTVYSESNELNHVKLIVVMLLTITFCFSLIFFGFIRVRRRLSSQLPFQSRAKNKFKLA